VVVAHPVVDAPLAGLRVRELGLLLGDGDPVGVAAVAQMGHDASPAAPAPGVEDPVLGNERSEPGGEEFGLGVFETVQFGGDALTPPYRIRFLEDGTVRLPEAVVVVVEVVEPAEFQVDRVLLGVPVVRDPVLVRRLGRHLGGPGACVGGDGQR